VAHLGLHHTGHCKFRRGSVSTQDVNQHLLICDIACLDEVNKAYIQGQVIIVSSDE
jgi:hypothetical protein